MKAVAALALVYAGLAAAQLNGLPDCAKSCAGNAFNGGSGYAGCGTDPKCICANSAFIGNIACCLQGSCDPQDQTSAVQFAQSLCLANGVTVPNAVSCATASSKPATTTGAAPATTTGSSSGSVSTTASSASSASTGSSGSSAPASSTSSSAKAAGTSSTSNFAAMPLPTAAAALGAGILGAVALL